jgi:hypothetical protein
MTKLHIYRFINAIGILLMFLILRLSRFDNFIWVIIPIILFCTFQIFRITKQDSKSMMQVFWTVVCLIIILCGLGFYLSLKP